MLGAGIKRRSCRRLGGFNSLDVMERSSFAGNQAPVVHLVT
jgi:hypothetical protein